MPGGKDIEAGRAFIRLGLKNDLTGKLKTALQGVGRQLRQTGVTLTKIGAGMSAAGGAIVAPIAGAVHRFAEAGDALDKMSKRTGVSAQSLAELGFAAEANGASLENVEGVLLKMNRRLGRLTTIGGPAKAAMEELGLSVEEIARMNPEQRFLALGEAIRNYGDDAAAAGLAQRALGTGVDKLLPLFKAGRGEIEKLRQKARDLKIVPTKKEVANAAAVTDALGEIKKQVDSLVQVIGAQFGEVIVDAAQSIKTILKTSIDWVRENGEIIKIVGAVGAALVTAGAAVTAIGGALIGAGAAFSALGTIIPILINPVTIIGGLLAAGVAAWARYTESGRSAVSSLQSALAPLGELFGELSETFMTAWGGIVDALKGGDLALAGKIAFTSLKLMGIQAFEKIKEMIPGLGNAIKLLTHSWQRNWELFKKAAWVGILAAKDRLKYVFMEWLPSVIAGLAGGLAGVFQVAIDNWKKIGLGFIKWYTQRWKILFDAVKKAFFAITKGLRQAFEGDIKKGIQTMLSGSIDAAKLFAKETNKNNKQLADTLGPIVQDAAKAFQAGYAAQGGANTFTEDAATQAARASLQELVVKTLKEQHERAGGKSPTAELSDELKRLIEQAKGGGKETPSRGWTWDQWEQFGKGVLGSLRGGTASATPTKGLLGHAGLGVTFSAAAAEAAGYKVSRPEEKMVDHLSSIDKRNAAIVEGVNRVGDTIQRLYDSFTYR